MYFLHSFNTLLCFNNFRIELQEVLNVFGGELQTIIVRVNKKTGTCKISDSLVYISVSIGTDT